MTASGWTNRIFRLNTKLHYLVHILLIVHPFPLPSSSLNPSCYLYTCLLASFHSPLSSPGMEASLSLADVLMSHSCGSVFFLRRLQQTRGLTGCCEKQREGLSGEAGLPSTTTPVETRAQSVGALRTDKAVRQSSAATGLFTMKGKDRTLYMTNGSSPVCTCPGQTGQATT